MITKTTLPPARRGLTSDEAAARLRVDGPNTLPAERPPSPLAHALAADESMLTGESVPARPEAGAHVHAGTFVTEGEAEAGVTATGMRTRLAGIAALTRDARRRPSPLASQLHRVVRAVAVLAVAVGAAFFTVAVLLGLEPGQGFLLAVGVTVALVPEVLLPTVTLSLACAAQRMARRKALVRRLEAVETLGSTTFICTDKTGTLTCNEITAVHVWTPSGTVLVEGEGYSPDARLVGGPDAVEAVRRLAVTAYRCSTGRARRQNGHWRAVGDPMEAALHMLALRAGADLSDEHERRRYPLTRGGGALPPLLLWAVATDLVLMSVFLAIPPVADLLGGGPPSPFGWLVAFTVIPAVLLVDAAAKAVRGRRNLGASRPATAGTRSAG
ncbi:HAD-IC family P-type ATPase [Actinomadura sp. 6N118]|uniref:HAD-IC family P-type ATPase n=1 Tax=Actinomadura sp. 6N118 TaxID=3375151 RepID=UPI00378A7875